MDFRVIYLSFRNFSITYQFFKKSYRGFFEIYQENQQKRGLKIAFYVDVSVFSLSNLATLKADISKTSSERYRFLFIFVCRTSKYTHMQKIKNFYREVNYVHLALSILLFHRKNINLQGHLIQCFIHMQTKLRNPNGYTNTKFC